MTILLPLNLLVQPFTRCIAERSLQDVTSFSLLDGEHDIENEPSAYLAEEFEQETIPYALLEIEHALESVSSYACLQA